MLAWLGSEHDHGGVTMLKNNVAQLPLGIQSFAEVREGSFAYVDKTAYALKLANEGKMYFLARPRRFGKSLFLDTLRNLFEGKRELFTGLHVRANWDWEIKYPVIKLDMSGGFRNADELSSMLADDLRYAADNMGIELAQHNDASRLFKDLLRKAHKHYGHKVVLLVDEYDKPMLDNIDDMELAQQMRKQLRGFYSIIKVADEHLRFVMLTGVSKFAKVSIFSGLNNLKDISLNPDYGSVCGYTETELEKVFSEHLRDVDREQLRQWYNGYNFLGDKLVYNPHDILHFIDRSQSFATPRFQGYWFESGTPAFLIDLIERDNLLPYHIEPVEANEELINSSPLDNIKLTAVLFQSGYLTIDAVNDSNPHDVIYKLVCPNNSVRSALHNSLFEHYTGNTDPSHRSNISSALRTAQLDVIESELKRLFASIAADNYRKNDIAHFEGYYASVVYCFFVGMGFDVTAEDGSSRGRVDLSIQFGSHTYVIEFKVVKRKSKANSALQQIIQRGYAAKYTGKVYQIGIEFSETRRNIVAFAWQQVPIITE